MKNIKAIIFSSIIFAILIVALSATVNAATGGVVITGHLPNTVNTIYNPELSAIITDSNNNDLNVIFETNLTGDWEIIGNYSGRNGLYTHSPSNMDVKNRIYYWRIRIFDGTSWKDSSIFSFTAKAIIPKWEFRLGKDTDAGPLAVDVNKDGIYEIFVSGSGKISCLDGATGNAIWNYTSTSINIHSPLEIADLNNDGVPEIVIPAISRTIALHANDGSVYWDVPQASGNKFLAILDTDGNKYPYVYAAYGDHFFGTGRIVKLRGTDGALMASTPVWYPCYSGISTADANNDGKFEIYMCDRKSGYEGPEGLGKGMQAYDADDLSLLWYDGSLTCSSHMIALIDVNKDGILDSIALPQSDKNGGIYVIDGATGTKMTGKWATNLGLGTHSPFSVHDIDNDGNLEIATSRLGSVKIWDIGSWSLDANLSDFNSTEPPRFADVIGDEKLEILTVGIDGIMRIYDWHYNLVETVGLGGRSISTIVQDIDNDGRNELISISTKGVVNAYDTSAYTPERHVRTNNQYYSEKRLGAGVYEPLPGAPQPIIKETYPADKAINIALNPKISARVIDFHYDLMDVEISTNVSGTWETVASFYDAENGWFDFQPTNMDYMDTTYYWKVTASDPGADNMVTEQTFSFTTAPQTWYTTGWQYRKQITIDHTKVSGDLTNFAMPIEFTDSDVAGKAKGNADDVLFTLSDGSTKLAHEIESYDSSTGHLVTWVNIPALSSTKDTILYLYYGNDAAENQENPAEVWDSNYLAVQHMEETEGTSITDSTGKNDGATENVNLDAQGKIDGADEYNGVNSIATLPQVFTNQTQFTVEGWVRVMDGSKTQAIFSQRNVTPKEGALMQYDPSGKILFYVNSKTAEVTLAGTTFWHYVAGTYNGNAATLYRDDYSPVSVAATTISWPNMPLYIGNRNTKDRTFSGMIDEIRISNVARSQAYISTNYNIQSNPTAAIILGDEEEAVQMLAVWGQTPAHLATNIPFSTTELSFNLFNKNNNPVDYTVTTSPNIGSGNGAQVSNGRFSVPVANLAQNTQYTWRFDATDGIESIHKEYTFKTAKGYTFNLTTIGSGTVESSCIFLCAANSEIEMTATPTPGWYFIGWAGGKVGAEISGLDNPKKFTITDNTKVDAIFRQIGVPLIVDSEFDLSSDSIDLRNNGTGQDWWESRSGFSGSDPTLLTLDTNDIGGNTGKKAKLAESLLVYNNQTNTSSYSGNAYMSQEFSAPQPFRTSIEWDIYVDTILDYGDVDRAGHQLIGTDSDGQRGPTSGSGERFVVLAFYHFNGSTVPGDTMSLIAQEYESTTSNSSTWITIADDLQMDKWYTIRVDIDMTTKTYDVYIDGVLRAEDIFAYNPLIRQITHISFPTWNDGVGTFYVDNVHENMMPICMDYDGDGYGDNCILGTDCNENNASINPGALEFCDGIDNNCNTEIDENDVCSATNYYCDNDGDKYISSVISGLCDGAGCVPSNCTEIQGDDCNDMDSMINPGADDSNCNGVDENCDGINDNSYFSQEVSCGTGVCAAIGSSSCTNGIEISDCTPNDPLSEQDTTCDNVDDNCNGFIDEDYIITSTNCGLGLCEATGQKVCVEGAEVDSCTPGTPSDEVCDGLFDENCNGLIDDGCSCIPGTSQSCGSSIGECRPGTQTCQPDETWGTCAGQILPAADNNCNGLDEDCDGTADNDYVPTITFCGAENCQGSGLLICSNGTTQDTCTPPSGENCIFCGDGTCNGEESCSNCATDCGACRRSSGGGGGGGSSIKCGNWSECVSGSQSQTCTYGSTSSTNKRNCVMPVQNISQNSTVEQDTTPVPIIIESNVSVEEEEDTTSMLSSVVTEKTSEEPDSTNEITGFVVGDSKSKTQWTVLAAAIALLVISLGVVIFVTLKNKKLK